MTGKPLDTSWKAWVEQNIGRGCDLQELLGILLEQQFSLESIRESMAGRIVPGSLARPVLGRRRLDKAWLAWIAENLDRGCDPAQLLGILLKQQFPFDAVRAALGARFPAGAEWLESAAHGEPDFRVIAEPPLVRRSAAVKVDSDKLQLYILDDFMSEAECADITALIGAHLRPSTVTIEITDRAYRTSRTCDLGLIESAAVKALDEKIARTLGIRGAYSESIQAQRYDAGQEFKAHTDFFEPGTPEYREHASVRGNRTWTFMVYLNDGMEGGGTRFFSIDKIFQPRRGRALAWNNLYPDGAPNYDTLHAGMPVTRATKLVITKWFRERGGGPMFYDE